MFWDVMTSKICTSIHSAYDSRRYARETVRLSDTNIILEAPDTESKDRTCPTGQRTSDLSWVPVTEVLALTCLYLLIANPFG